MYVVYCKTGYMVYFITVKGLFTKQTDLQHLSVLTMRIYKLCSAYYNGCKTTWSSLYNTIS